MTPRRLLPFLLLFLAAPSVTRADAFDHYTNPVLARVPGAEGVQAVERLTPELIADHDRVLPGITSALLVVKTNEGRFAKLLVQAGRQKTATGSLPTLLVERYVTYKEGQERAVKVAGQNLALFNGFRLNLDVGQVVPEELGGDVRFVVEGNTVALVPLGKAQLYLVTKPVPEATPKKSARLQVGDVFEPRYFNGSYKLYDDGRRSGSLTLQVADDGEVSGVYYSDRDGQKYEVKGKIGTPKHQIQFSIRFPKVEQFFQGWLFTGNAKALAGSSRLLDRETGFYAVRTDDE